MFNKQIFAFVALAAFASATIVARAPSATFPTPPTTSSLSKAQTIPKGKNFTPPKAYTRFDRGKGACGGQTEGGSADAVFILEDGASLSNVVIGKDQAEGVHCLGACTLTNVFFEDVCEDAISIKGNGNAVINGGGAKNAEDKVVQHNGIGKVTISNFYVSDFGKLYRSCGNCKVSGPRTSEINNVVAVNGKVLAGVNSNFGDVVTIRNTQVTNVKEKCERFQGTTPGNEPKSLGKGPDGKSCIVA